MTTKLKSKKIFTFFIIACLSACGTSVKQNKVAKNNLSSYMLSSKIIFNESNSKLLSLVKNKASICSIDLKKCKTLSNLQNIVDIKPNKDSFFIVTKNEIFESNTTKLTSIFKTSKNISAVYLSNKTKILAYENGSIEKLDNNFNIEKQRETDSYISDIFVSNQKIYLKDNSFFTISKLSIDSLQKESYTQPALMISYVNYLGENILGVLSKKTNEIIIIDMEDLLEVQRKRLVGNAINFNSTNELGIFYVLEDLKIKKYSFHTGEINLISEMKLPKKALSFSYNKKNNKLYVNYENNIQIVESF